MSLRNLVLVFAAAGMLAAQTGDADVLLQRAIRQESVEGDLTGAIDLYKKVIAEAGKNRGAAARALLRLGECYEKQGSAEAQKAYERLVREFSDQAAPAREARARMSAMGLTRDGKTVTAQLIGRGSDLGPGGRVTADGKLYVFVDTDRNLAVRDLQAGTVRRLTNDATGSAFGEAGALSPVPSRSGKQIVYSWNLASSRTNQHMELRVINADGSGMRTVSVKHKPGYDYQVVDLNGDGDKALVWGFVPVIARRDGAPAVGNGPLILDLRTGEERRIPWRRAPLGSGAEMRRSSTLSPDGRWIVYSRTLQSGGLDWDIFAVNTETGQERAIVTGASSDRNPVWTPNGDRIIFRSDRNGKDAIWLARFYDGQISGEPTLIKADAGDYTPVGVSRDGSVFYTLSHRSSDVYQATVDPQTLRVHGAPARILESWLGRNSLPSWSPSGDSFAYYSEREFNKGSRLVIRRSDGNETVAALPISSCCNAPHWCGGDVLYSRAPNPGTRVVLFDARSGQTQPEQTITGLRGPYQTGIAPDCKSVFVSAYKAATQRRRIYQYDLARKTETELLDDAGEWAIMPVASPDGQWLALFGTPEGSTSTKRTILLLPTGGGPLRTIDAEAVGVYGWTPDSKRLIYTRRVKGTDEREMYQVPVEGGTPQPMGIRMPNPSVPSLNPDGKRILFSATEVSNELWVLRNLPLN